MAKDRQRQVEEFSQDPVDIETEKRMQEMRHKMQLEQFEDKIAKLEQNATDYYLKYGEDDYRTALLISFLDVALYMKEAIAMIEDIKTSIMCVTDAMQCIDNVYTEIMDAFQGSINQKYGVIQRLKQRRRLNKVIKNNVGRMTMMCNMITGAHKMAFGMMKAMKKVGVKLNKKMNKAMEQQNKANSKGGEPAISPAKALVMQNVQARKDDVGYTSFDTSFDSSADTSEPAPDDGDIDEFDFSSIKDKK